MDQNHLKEELEKLHAEGFIWAVRCCHEDRADAEDVLQNTYLKILEGKAKFKNQSSFKTWLFSVIRYTAIDFLKNEKKKRLIELNNHSVYSEEIQINSELNYKEEEVLQREFKLALEKLSTQQHYVLHLVFYQNMTIQEAAEIMGIRLGTARTHYERGKQQLKKWLVKNDFFQKSQ